MPDVTRGGIRVHYAAAPPAPRAPAIVLLHGAGANHSVWLGVLPLLRERAWVVLPDLPGHGASQEIAGLTIDDQARALEPFLEWACAESRPGGGGGAVVLGGHSMGGAIALTAALARPDLVSALVLAGTGAKLGVSPQILEGLEKAPAETAALVVRWSYAAAADPALMARALRDLAGASAARTLTDFRACNAYDLRDRLATIAAPALVLCGAEDRMTPPKSSAYLAEHLPRARAEIIADAGHAVMIEQPAAVVSAIGRFLDGLAI